MDNQGLEAGLSYIGLVLEAAERQIAEFWAAYEERDPSKRNVATIKYPDRYSLKTDSDRITEAENLVKLMYAVPGQKVKRELAKNIVLALLGRQRSASATSKPSSTRSTRLLTPPAIRRPSLRRSQAGLCGEKTAAMALGFQRRRAPASPCRSCGQGDSDFASPAEGRRDSAIQTTGGTSRDPATEQAGRVGIDEPQRRGRT